MIHFDRAENLVLEKDDEKEVTCSLHLLRSRNLNINIEDIMLK